MGQLVSWGDDIAGAAFRVHALAVGKVGDGKRRAQQDQSIWRHGGDSKAVNYTEHAGPAEKSG